MAEVGPLYGNGASPSHFIVWNRNTNGWGKLFDSIVEVKPRPGIVKEEGPDGSGSPER